LKPCRARSDSQKRSWVPNGRPKPRRRPAPSRPAAPSILVGCIASVRHTGGAIWTPKGQRTLQLYSRVSGPPAGLPQLSVC
jgi:hypothetical protein